MTILEKLTELFGYDPQVPMVFHSGLFLFLFPVFMICYYLLRERRQWRILYVLAFSYFFYYKSSGLFFLLLFFTSVFDYLMAKIIYTSRREWQKRFFVTLSITANLGVLGYFKYADFFREAWCEITGVEFLPWAIILPVGISFFTFQSLSYTIDVYRGQVTPLRRFMDYAFFVSFFPQLVAGPIVRARDFIPQMMAKVTVTYEMFGHGLFLILTGLFKKAVISDYISINFVDRIFDAPALYSGVENLMAIYGYALQIYCDFSGYSDMAIGIALLLGFRFKMNFNSPYQSQSITEFWKRWHISLSTWLRDYLYIPLGGNRKGEWRTYTNLLATMLLGGLWHGASLRFVFWGGWHGSWLIVERLYRKRRIQQFGGWCRRYVETGCLHIVEHTSERWVGMYRGVRIMGSLLKKVGLLIYYSWKNNPLLRKIVRILLTFHIVCVGWVFFRASTFSAGWEMLGQVFGAFRGYLFPQWLDGYTGVAVLMVLGYLLHLLPESTEHWAIRQVVRAPLIVKAAILVMVIFVVMQIKSSEILPFIYFQF